MAAMADTSGAEKILAKLKETHFPTQFPGVLQLVYTDPLYIITKTICQSRYDDRQMTLIVETNTKLAPIVDRARDCYKGILCSWVEELKKGYLIFFMRKDVSENFATILKTDATIA